MPLGFRASSTPTLRSVLAIRHAPTDHTPGNWRIPRLALEPIIDCGSSRETLAMAIPLQGCGTDRKARDAGEKYAKLHSTSPAGSAPAEVGGQFVGAPLGLRARVGRFGQAEVSGSATWTFASRHEDVSPPAVARMCPSALCSPGSRAHTACRSTVIVNQAAGSRG